MPYGNLGEATLVRGGRRLGLHQYNGKVTFPTAASVALVTPFRTIVSVQATLEKGTTLGAGTAFVTYTVSGSTVTFFAWVVAGTANAAATEVVSVSVAGQLSP